MSQPTTKKYSAEFKEHAVKLAVESEQPIAQTARDLGVNENTLHTWIGQYHRAEHRKRDAAQHKEWNRHRDDTRVVFRCWPICGQPKPLKQLFLRGTMPLL